MSLKVNASTNRPCSSGLRWNGSNRVTVGIYGTIYLIVYDSIGRCMMIIGLARTSTLEQIAGLEAQVRDLEAYGCERIFKEQVSSIAEREQLEAALNTLREGDKLVCTRLDRLARSV